MIYARNLSLLFIGLFLFITSSLTNASSEEDFSAPKVTAQKIKEISKKYKEDDISSPSLSFKETRLKKWKKKKKGCSTAPFKEKKKEANQKRSSKKRYKFKRWHDDDFDFIVTPPPSRPLIPIPKENPTRSKITPNPAYPHILLMPEITLFPAPKDIFYYPKSSIIIAEYPPFVFRNGHLKIEMIQRNNSLSGDRPKPCTIYLADDSLSAAFFLFQLLKSTCCLKEMSGEQKINFLKHPFSSLWDQEIPKTLKVIKTGLLSKEVYTRDLFTVTNLGKILEEKDFTVNDLSSFGSYLLALYMKKNPTALFKYNGRSYEAPLVDLSNHSLNPWTWALTNQLKSFEVSLEKRACYSFQDVTLAYPLPEIFFRSYFKRFQARLQKVHFSPKDSEEIASLQILCIARLMKIAQEDSSLTSVDNLKNHFMHKNFFIQFKKIFSLTLESSL